MIARLGATVLVLLVASGPLAAAAPADDRRGGPVSLPTGSWAPIAETIDLAHPWRDDGADGDGRPEADAAEGTPDTDRRPDTEGTHGYEAEGTPEADAGGAPHAGIAPDADGDGVPDSIVLAADTEVAAAGIRKLIPAGRLTKRPFRGIVLVSIGSNVVCTGFVVAPRKVVTAAHCLTRDAAGGNFRFRDGLPDNIRLYRAYSLSAGGSPYATCDVVRAWAHPRFIRGDSNDQRYGSNSHDYAVLTTEAGCTYPRNAVMRMWATTESGNEIRSGRTMQLGGYPADPRFEGMNGLNLWRTSGSAQPNGGDERILFTTGFVAQGMSGGPVWRSFKQDSPCGRAQCVVGVLTECAVSPSGLCRLGDSTRRAVRITPSVKRLIRKR